MADATIRKITEYRWICTNKALCELLDEAIADVMGAASSLSHCVATKQITGLECIRLDNKFQCTLRGLKDQRKTLWRRVRREIEEVTESDEVAKPLVNIGVVTRNEPARVA